MTEGILARVVPAPLRLLRSASDWTQGADARDAERRPVGTHEMEACTWCLRGAIKRTTTTQSEYLAVLGAFEHRLRERGLLCGLVVWNDLIERTFDDVRELLASMSPSEGDPT